MDKRRKLTLYYKIMDGSASKEEREEYKGLSCNVNDSLRSVTRNESKKLAEIFDRYILEKKKKK